MAATHLGYVKYTGRSVEGGLLDARKSAQALLGVDEALRFFIGYQDPRLRNFEYEIPVRVRTGSWEVLVPHTVGEWVATGLATSAGIVVTEYLKTAAAKLAEKDFDGISTKDLFVKALHGIQWTLRLGKHLGDVTSRTFRGIKWRRGNTEVGITNAEGKTLYVPRPYVDMYVAAPPNLLEKLASLVEEERTLVVGVVDGSRRDEEKLTRPFKYIFVEEAEDEEELFPELKHGDRVKLDGDLTRGNETSNTLGFKYKGHTLVCYPHEGSIVRFKPALFGPVRMHGTVSRLDEFHRISLKRPHIEVQKIERRPSDKPRTLDLFDNAESRDEQ